MQYKMADAMTLRYDTIVWWNTLESSLLLLIASTIAFSSVITTISVNQQKNIIQQKLKIWFQKYSHTKRGELKVMLRHSDWHDLTLSVLKCKGVRKIYRDHPFGLNPYHILLLHHFILHNTPMSRRVQPKCCNKSCWHKHFLNYFQKMVI